jgi:hypothetical protein
MRAQILLCCMVVVLLAQAPLTNADVIRMKQAGLSDTIILKRISDGKNAFDTSANGLVSLKTAGLSDAVIRAMMGLPPTPDAPAPRQPMNSPEITSLKTHAWPVPESYGVFVESDRSLIPLPVWQGPLKPNKKRAVATASGAGFWAKTKNGAHLPGVRANVRADAGVRLAIRQSEARVPSLRLVVLDVAEGEREAVISGRVWSTTSHEENGVPFDLIRLDAELFRMVPRMPLKPGEYGVIDTSTYNQSTATVYAFGVDGSKQ